MMRLVTVKCLQLLQVHKFMLLTARFMDLKKKNETSNYFSNTERTSLVQQRFGFDGSFTNIIC